MKQAMQQAVTGDCGAETCPVARAHAVLGGRWTTLIFRELLPGRKRYSELMRGLEGISPKMLAERLRMLEDEGLVMRRIHPTRPPTTDYELTELGRGMEPVIAAMAQFGLSLQTRG